jgi:hypothetical protein
MISLSLAMSLSEGVAGIAGLARALQFGSRN